MSNRKAPNEFHDLAEQLLNREGDGTSCWGNFGYWENATTYPEACTALAEELGKAVALQPDDQLLDIGFGAGDQLLHWAESFGVAQISGLNLSESQTRYAQQRLVQKDQTQIAKRIECGDVRNLKAWVQKQKLPAPNVIVALDSAYHFYDRQTVLQDFASLIAPNGRLGVTDLVLLREPSSPFERAAITLMAKLSHIPRQNLVSEAKYRKQWMSAGLEIEGYRDITAFVFSPFKDWLRRYKRHPEQQSVPQMAWIKYDVTARFLVWARQRELLGYVLCHGTLK